MDLSLLTGQKHSKLETSVTYLSWSAELVEVGVFGIATWQA